LANQTLGGEGEKTLVVSHLMSKMLKKCEETSVFRVDLTKYDMAHQLELQQAKRLHSSGFNGENLFEKSKYTL
jgi:hypothetical protein